MNSLTGLSDQALVNQLRKLVRQEQNLTLQILPHLVEVIRRGLHLSKGYASLYEYCKGELGYTDASAWRRTRAAQAIVRCPEAWNRLKERKISLCTLGRVHKFITPALLREICGRSKAEVELIAAAYDSRGLSPDRARPVMVPKSDGPRPLNDRPPSIQNTSLANPRGEVNSGNGQQSPPLRGEVSLTNIKLSFEQMWKIEGLVSQAVKAKLDRCKMLLSRKYPQGVDYDILFNELAELFLDRADPECKKERRDRRRGRSKVPPRVASKATPSRHIPPSEKEKVWVRDGGRCTYVGNDGKRCNSTHSLQYDHHPKPFSFGGPSTADNLRLLCAKHNRFTADRRYGTRYSSSSLHPRDAKGTETPTHKTE